jgi:hypothetical protein
MIKMDAPIVMQHPRDVGNWILASAWLYRDGNTEREIPRGFVFDFASVPKLFWNIISPTELGDKGPLEHDWEYRNGIGPRRKADKRLMAYMEKRGIKWWKRQAAYQLVRAWGWRSWNSGKVVIEELAAA